MYLYTHMQITAVNKKRKHEFEREQGYRRVWREERKGKGNYITISKTREIL